MNFISYCELFYAVNYSMHVLIIMFDPVICKTPDAPLHCLPFCKAKWQYFEGMWQTYMHFSGNLVSFLTVEFL